MHVPDVGVICEIIRQRSIVGSEEGKGKRPRCQLM